MAEKKSDAPAVPLKVGLLKEIEKIFVKHPEGEEWKSKISRMDDCFAVLFDPNNEVCKRCKMVVEYEGQQTTVDVLCQKLMGMKLITETEPQAQNQEGGSMAEKKKAEKKAPTKKEGAKEGGRRQEVLDCLKAGIKTQPEMVKKLGCQNATVNQVLRKLVEEKLVSREKEGKSFVYSMK